MTELREWVEERRFRAALIVRLNAAMNGRSSTAQVREVGEIEKE